MLLIFISVRTLTQKFDTYLGSKAAEIVFSRCAAICPTMTLFYGTDGEWIQAENW